MAQNERNRLNLTTALRGPTGKGLATGAAVIAAGAAIATSIVLRWQIAKMVGVGAVRAARFGRSASKYGGKRARQLAALLDVDRMLAGVGLARRRPIYVRALPGIGAFAGLLAAAGAAAVFAAPRLRAERERRELHGTGHEPAQAGTNHEPISSSLNSAFSAGEEAMPHAR